MEKTRITVTVGDQDLKIAGDESEAYIRELAGFVNGKIDEVQSAYPNMSGGVCALLATLNIADELHKLKEDYKALDNRISQLMDMPAMGASNVSLPKVSTSKTGALATVPVKRPFEAKQTVETK